MRALIQRRYGAPSTLELENVPVPSPAEGQVLCRVEAVSLNSLDWRRLRAKPFLIRLGEGLVRPKNPLLGVDFAGTVVRVGPAVSNFVVGDPVFGLGEGALAEFTLAMPERLVRRDPRLPAAEASTLPIAGCTALLALRDRGHLVSGQRVLVFGAGGGVGTFAVQLARVLGATVTAATSGGNVDRIRSLGAETVLDYRRDGLDRYVGAFDLIIDISGTVSFRILRRSLRPQGRIVMVGGNGTARLLNGVIQSRFRSRRVSLFMARVVANDLEYLQRLALEGRLRPTIEWSYPLTESPAAFTRFESHQVVGKLVVTVP
jgi:NADPH:quinone reductase-like Zn-dependent oxidoreductase